MGKTNPFIDKWRITEMELWDQDFIDLETEGFLLFEKDGMGSFHFGAVSGELDYRIEKTEGMERLEFSWQGQDEMDEASGRGWAVIKDNQIEGRFYFFLGDDSWFRAKRI